MQVTHYKQYHGLKLKDSEEFILSPKLMKESKLRKHKSSITEYKKILAKTYMVLQLNCPNF